LKVHFKIILPSTPRFSKGTLSIRYHHQSLVCYTHSPSHVS
jgi:hypothetical protein